MNNWETTIVYFNQIWFCYHWYYINNLCFIWSCNILMMLDHWKQRDWRRFASSGQSIIWKLEMKLRVLGKFVILVYLISLLASFTFFYNWCFLLTLNIFYWYLLINYSLIVYYLTFCYKLFQSRMQMIYVVMCGLIWNLEVNFWVYWKNRQCIKKM